MRADTFKSWLESKGCSFDEQQHKRGTGPAGVIAKREGRKSEVPLTATNQDLKHQDITRVLKELGLEGEQLPGPTTGPQQVYKNTSSVGHVS
jgi:hypothetical protein